MWQKMYSLNDTAKHEESNIATDTAESLGLNQATVLAIIGIILLEL